MKKLMQKLSIWLFRKAYGLSNNINTIKRKENANNGNIKSINKV